MLGGLITYARAGQVCFITPFILAGAMSPITMAAALAQQNAEALAGVALTQLVRPGAPVVYGGFTTMSICGAAVRPLARRKGPGRCWWGRSWPGATTCRTGAAAA